MRSPRHAGDLASWSVDRACRKGKLAPTSSVVEPEALQALALSVAAARSPDSVLEQVVRGLAKNPGVALARVWLVARTPRSLAPPGIRPGDPFLELKASVGRSIERPGLLWDRLDGEH